MFYNNKPETRGKLYFSSKLWAAATVRSLLDSTFALWNNRCDIIHGVNKEGSKRIIKKNSINRVGELYENKAEIEKE